MRLEEWRQASSSVAQELYARERERWRRELHWDPAASWAIVEGARADASLPGFVAFDDDDRPVGWSYFLVRDRTLQIGALDGERAEVVRALLDAVLEAPEASLAARYQCFVFSRSPAIRVALERRRFAIERYLYLERPLDRTGSLEPDGRLPHGVSVRCWSASDLPCAVRLMARAYAGTASARCFAPMGRLEEWTTYLAQLVHTPACGELAREESLAIGEGGRMTSFLVATHVDPETSHVAQVVVDPAARRRGEATALLAASARVAVRQGAVRQTLLVAESNVPARAVYARLGFHERATFLFADRERITRTSARPAESPGRVLA